MRLPRFGLSYTVGPATSSLTHLDLPSEVQVTIDGRSFRIVVEEGRIFIETFDQRMAGLSGSMIVCTAVFPERELLAEYSR